MPPYGMTAGAPVNDITMNPALQALRAQQNQQAHRAVGQQQQADNDVNQARTNAETARREAQIKQRRDDSVMGMMALREGGVASTDDYGTSYAFPGGGSSSTTQRQSASGGSAGVRQFPPDMQGRFMPLVELGQIDQTPPQLPAQVQRAGGSFTPEDATAHQNAAYARLKATSGQAGRSAVDSLAAEMGGRGIGGSGTFMRGVGDRIASAVQPLADLNVAHLGEEYNAAGRARQLAEQAASESYQGGISQRATDISAAQALQQLRAQLAAQKYSGEISQRGQDLDMKYRML